MHILNSIRVPTTCGEIRKKCLFILVIAEAVDINLTTFKGETALLLACRMGNSDCVRRLLEAGANKDISTNKNSTLFESSTFTVNIGMP